MSVTIPGCHKMGQNASQAIGVVIEHQTDERKIIVLHVRNYMYSCALSTSYSSGQPKLLEPDFQKINIELVAKSNQDIWPKFYTNPDGWKWILPKLPKQLNVATQRGRENMPRLF